MSSQQSILINEQKLENIKQSISDQIDMNNRTSKYILINESTLAEHIEKQKNDYNNYVANLFLLIFRYNTKFTQIKMARILAASMMRNDKKLSSFLLKKCNYDLPIVFKTCVLLDSRRQCKSIEKRLINITNAKNISKYKSIISNLKTLHEDLPVSLNSSRIRFLKETWIHDISKSELEESVIRHPIFLWKKLIDLLHLRPNDFKLKWFTSYVFTGKYPKKSIIGKFNRINENNIFKIVNKYKPHFTYIRDNYAKMITDELKEILVKYTPLNDIIVNWDFFNTPSIYEIVCNRLGANEFFDMPYGELIKRIQMMDIKDELLDSIVEISGMIGISYNDFIDYIENLPNNWYDYISEDNLYNMCLANLADQYNIEYYSIASVIMEKHNKSNQNCRDKLTNNLIKIAENKLNQYMINIEQPVVVFGDASGSMDVAIKTSGIIMSILCKVCNAKMHLFRNKDEEIKTPPKNVNDVLDLVKKCKAYNGTSPALSLLPYLQNKKIAKTFIIVTDEIENIDADGKWIEDYDTDNDKTFSHIFKKYRDTVYKSKLVFVSFVPNNKDGQMVSELKTVIPGIEKDIIQFRLNIDKPDLRKLDSLLKTLEMNTNIYDKECKILSKKIKNNEPYCKKIINDMYDDQIDNIIITI